MADRADVPDKRQKIIYIAGLPGSGSTILGLLLPQYSRAMDLGEVEPALRLKMDRVRDRHQGCSCGQPVSNCDFWAPVLARMKGKSGADRHAALLAYCRKHYPDVALVDVSKSAAQLSRTWLASEVHDQVDVRVIYIVRDYRGWALTQRRKHWRRGGIARFKPLFWHCMAWYLRNKLRARRLRDSGLPVMTLSYESMVHNPREELRRIAGFAGLDYAPQVADSSQALMHDCHGNGRVRKNRAHHGEIRYDYRWTLDTRFQLLAPLLIPVHRYWRRINERSGVVELNTTRAAFWQEKKA